MKDQVSIARLATLHPIWRKDVENFIDEIEANTFKKFRIVQALRTFAEQDALYAQGRTTPGKIVTYSPAGASYHNFGLAFDGTFFTLDGLSLDWNYNFELLRPYARKYGMRMGLDFPHPDKDHFENPRSYNWRDLLHMHNAGQFIPDTQYVNIS